MNDNTVKIILNFIDQASAPLAAAAGAVQGALNGLGSTAASSTSLIGTVFQKMGGAVKGILGEMFDSTNKWASLFVGGTLLKSFEDLTGMAAKFERFGKAAEFLTGSADAADKFAASVRKMATETMFNVDQIAELDSRLVGNTKNVELSEKTLMALSEAVAATGGGYSELEGATRAWIQINSKGKASLEELNRQLSNANIPVMRLLAESIVNDADNPLRKFITTTQTAGGETKKMATEMTKAGAVIQDNTYKHAELADKLDKATNKFGANAYQTLKARDALSDWDAKVKTAQGTLNSHTAAVSKNTSVTKLSVEQVMSQLQDLGKLNIPGAIMAEAVTQSLQKAYGGANQALIQTFDGQMSLLKDTFKLTTLSFMGLDENFRVVKGGILDMLTNAIRPLVIFLQTHQEEIAKFASGLASSTPFLLAVAGAIVGVLMPAVTGLIAVLGIKAAIWGTLGLILAKIIDKMGGVEVVFERVKNKFNALGEAYQKNVEPQLNRLHNFFDSKIMPKLKEFSEYIETRIIPRLNRMGDAIKQNVVPMFDRMGQVAGETSQTIKDKLAQIGDVKIGGGDATMGEAFMGLLNILGRIGDFVKGEFKSIWQEFKTSFNQIDPKTIQELKDSFVLLFETTAPLIKNLVMGFALVAGAIATVIGGIVSGFASALPFVIQLVANFVNLVSNLISFVIAVMTGNWSAAGEAIRGVWESLVNIIKSLLDGLTAFVFGFITGIITFFKLAFETITGKDAPKFVDDIIGAMRSAKEGMISAFNAVFDFIRDGFSALVSSAVNWGKDLINNVVRGIAEAAKALGGNSGNKLLDSLGWKGLFEHGGIVPGAIGEAVPIIAHGGERITPVTGSDVGSSNSNQFSINFYGGVTVDSPDRVNELAKTVARLLGRQSELARYGAGV